MKYYYDKVEDFYDNGEILLTGGTGFLGKILIDKLLRSFPTIKNIYMIVREKKGINPQTRIEQLFHNVIFEKLVKEVPDFKSKIKVLHGNIQEPDLGLCKNDKILLVSKVNIVFHCAATLRFDEELKIAIHTNITATLELLNLAKECTNLKMFTYVSTAYSNCNHKHVEEKIYNLKTHYSELLKLTNLKTDDMDYELIKLRLSKENVNTYTLTKAAAEQMLSEEGENFPVSIFRPGIIISTWKEPISGWIDNLYGPTGLVTAVQAGFVRSIYCNPDVKTDMVPVDLTVNALVCSPVHSFNEYHKKLSKLPIYNYISSSRNPITYYDFALKTYEHGCAAPPSRILWYPVIYITKYKFVHIIQSIFIHYAFGIIFDICAWISGNKLRLIPLYGKLNKVIKTLEPFTTQDWEFDDENVQQMWNNLSETDQKKFPFNIKDLEWDDYLCKYISGTMVYHLQDKLDPVTRRKALERLQKLKIVHYLVCGLFFCLLVYFILAILDLII